MAHTHSTLAAHPFFSIETTSHWPFHHSPISPQKIPLETMKTHWNPTENWRQKPIHFVAQLGLLPSNVDGDLPTLSLVCWSSLDSAWSHLQNNSEAGRIQWWYCWWIRNPAITSWYGRFPIVYKALCIPGGAGFLPSTVMMQIVG